MNDKYHVVLRSDLPASELSILNPLSLPLRPDEETELRVLLCSEVDVSHHNYMGQGIGVR